MLDVLVNHADMTSLSTWIEGLIAFPLDIVVLYAAMEEGDWSWHQICNCAQVSEETKSIFEILYCSSSQLYALCDTLLYWMETGEPNHRPLKTICSDAVPVIDHPFTVFLAIWSSRSCCSLVSQDEELNVNVGRLERVVSESCSQLLAAYSETDLI